MKAMEAVRDDPLFYVRHHVRDIWQCGIYEVGLPRNLDWASCWLDDKDVPGTRAHREDQKAMAQIFETAEAKALAKKRNERKGAKR
jgi:hypothetical protein